jgi:hypothetical protein
VVRARNGVAPFARVRARIAGPAAPKRRPAKCSRHFFGARRSGCRQQLRQSRGGGGGTICRPNADGGANLANLRCTRRCGLRRGSGTHLEGSTTGDAKGRCCRSFSCVVMPYDTFLLAPRTQKPRGAPTPQLSSSYDWRATHPRRLLPAVWASVPFGFVLVRVHTHTNRGTCPGVGL